MQEVGIDITGEFPKPWTDEILRAADVVVTMGCGDECPFSLRGNVTKTGPLDDPAGQGIEAVRPIRDEIRRRVTEFSRALTSRSGSGAQSLGQRRFVLGLVARGAEIR